jgi:hypothetical protein
LKELRTIQCDGHGEAYETYVCEHLMKKAAQVWFSDYPGEDNPWPDAWCAKCDVAYQREGEWNERNESEMRIKLVCSACYVERRMRSVESLAGPVKKRWKAYVADCCGEQDARQERMIAALGLDRYARIGLDTEQSELVFSDDALPRLATEVEAIGSVSRKSDTWLWAWANFHLPAVVRSRIGKVREIGEREGFLHLTEPKWAADEHDGWHMAAIGARALGALGVYRLPGDQVTTFLAIMSVRKE